MCGIAGFFGQQDHFPKHEEEFLKTLDVLKRRGPDNQSVWIKDYVALGHTRLSIIDLSTAANQPFVRKDLGLTIVFNGEVFNYLEIRTELVACGYVFKTNSDTEIVLCAWHKWGKDALHKFNGMWAFAMYNMQSEQLILCRDRFGIKPLYYSLQGNALCFASETNWFKQVKNFKLEIDPILEQLELNEAYSLEGKGLTQYKGIKQLLPGHILTIDKNETQYTRWYNVFDYITECSFNKNTFLGLLKNSIKLRLRSDVPIATALSGGLDSASVYALVLNELRQDKSKAAKVNSKAFTVSFPGTEQDESRAAEQLAKYLQGNLTNIVVAKETHDKEKVVFQQHFDAIGKEKVTAIYKIYEAMHQNGISVSLDGHGVDEMLYGYLGNVYNCFEYALANDSMANARLFGQVLIGMNDKYDETYVLKRLEWKRLSDNRKINRIKKWLPSKKERFYVTLPNGSSATRHEVNSYYDKVLFDEFFIKTLPSLLRNFDKASMFSSVEVRMPFMDYRIVEYCFSLGWKEKIKGGMSKYLLRKTMEGILPDETRFNKLKIGIQTP